MPGQSKFDLLVIGGGINGCGIARDAVGRGYRVALAEMTDFASGALSGATKLIHGCLRYLEFYVSRLVHEALVEREVLWAMAPHIIWPLRFVLPFHKGGIGPAWLIRPGLFLYDRLGGRKLLPATTTVDMRRGPAGKPWTACIHLLARISKPPKWIACSRWNGRSLQRTCFGVKQKWG